MKTIQIFPDATQPTYFNFYIAANDDEFLEWLENLDFKESGAFIANTDDTSEPLKLATVILHQDFTSNEVLDKNITYCASFFAAITTTLADIEDKEFRDEFYENTLSDSFSILKKHLISKLEVIKS